MEKPNIDLLIHKKLTNQINELELKTLNELIAADLEAKHDALALENVWTKSANLANEVKFDKNAAFNKFISKIEEKHTDNQIDRKSFRLVSMRSLMAIAAMFALAFFAFNIITKTNLTEVSSGSVPTIVSLPDGSEVKLAANSSLAYNKSTFNDNRQLKVSGKVVIHAAKTGKKFLVNADDFDVQVLGTTFFIESTSTSRNVKVLEGKVEVSNKSQKILVTDRQGVVITDKLSKVDDISFNSLGMQNDEMTYNNTPLSKVLSDVENKFSITISLKSTSDITNCTFTAGNMDKMTLDQIISVIESAFNTKFVKKSANSFDLGRVICK